MDVSKFTISQKNTPGLNRRGIAELRNKKLNELTSEDWSKFKHRSDIARACGILNESKGASWVHRMIHMHRITEEPGKGGKIYLPGPKLKDKLYARNIESKAIELATKAPSKIGTINMQVTKAPSKIGTINMQVTKAGQMITFNNLNIEDAIRLLKEM